jgi:hypothetical protein
VGCAALVTVSGCECEWVGASGCERLFVAGRSCE